MKEFCRSGPLIFLSVFVDELSVLLGVYPICQCSGMQSSFLFVPTFPYSTNCFVPKFPYSTDCFFHPLISLADGAVF